MCNDFCWVRLIMAVPDLLYLLTLLYTFIIVVFWVHTL